MPFLGVLLRLFGVFVVERLGKYLLGLGAFGVAYVGIDLLINRVVNNMVSSLGDAPADIYNILMMAGFGVAINVILSACAFAVAIGAAKGAAK